MLKRCFAYLIVFGGTLGMTMGQNQAPTTAPSPVPAAAPTPVEVQVFISVPEQKLALVVNGKVLRTYKVSTSRYGEGDYLGSWRTPLGRLAVANKIGGSAPAGAVFNGRHLTGEILSVNAPGRDPIVSRIIWLRGMESGNKYAYRRCIYIHGTPQEEFLGKKSSFGCIRMASSDVMELFPWIQVGTEVAIVDRPINRSAIKEEFGQAPPLVAKSNLRPEERTVAAVAVR
jgi:lipoprotein-anchoring transpeptidase ErfK/SrfK